MQKFIKNFLSESSWISSNLDVKKIGLMVKKIKSCKKNKGRIFFLGVGGSAGNASHAVNDFRKIIGIESYAPTDNVSELTARTNDEGWDSVFSDWLKINYIKYTDIATLYYLNISLKVLVNCFFKEVLCFYFFLNIYQF